MSKDRGAASRHGTLQLMSQGHAAWTWAWLTGSAPTPRRAHDPATSVEAARGAHDSAPNADHGAAKGR